MNLTIKHNEVAAWLAHQSNCIQSEFLTTFLNELIFACETRYKAELQLLYIAGVLKPFHKELLQILTSSEET